MVGPERSGYPAMSMRARGSTSLAPALVCALAAAFSSSAFGMETVDLVPDEAASFRLARVFSILRPGHNFSERTITVETTPPGANLDLFYIRANFQKRYEQAEAPVRIQLPRRVEAGPRDAVKIRAFLEGYRQKEVSIRVSSRQDRVLLELEPLPNQLVGVANLYFAGRTALSFLTTEALTVRVQESDAGFNVILAETAAGAEVSDSVEAIRNPLIREVEPNQLGEDLLVRVATTKPLRASGLELRSRQSRDDLRDLYVYSVDMVPGDRGAAAVRRARAALARIGPQDVSGCALAFDDVLRQSLDTASLSRALAPRGAFTDPYLRAAMKRLGEVSPGARIAMLDGSRFDAARPIELHAAQSQPAEAKGYLALLRTLVDALEPEGQRARALRSLLAPEMSVARFDAALARAEASEKACATP
jgi:hypothetical protein